MPKKFLPKLQFEQDSNSVWQAGYSLDTSLHPRSFRLSNFCDTVFPIAMWHPSSTVYYPYVVQNRDTQLRSDPSNSWALQAGEIGMEASASGQYSLLRFKAPYSGRYKITAKFAGIHKGLSTTDVHILLDSTLLFSDIIMGYGGDTSFYPTTGSRPKTTYAGTHQLARHSIVTFAVGYGQNQSHYYDTNGLQVEIEKED